MFCKCLSGLSRAAINVYSEHKPNAVYREAGRLTSSQTRPPRLWQTKIIGRLFCKNKLRSFNMYLVRFTGLSYSLYVATAFSRFREWFPILFSDTMPRQSATYASYPNVRIRALGILAGNKVLGHGEVLFFAVHVFSRSPVRPWTNITLQFDNRILATGSIKFEHSTKG